MVWFKFEKPKRITVHIYTIEVLGLLLFSFKDYVIVLILK